MNYMLIFFNTLSQASGRLISGLVVFVTTLLLARTLGGERYGELTKIISFVSLFYIATDLGMNTIYIRDYKNKIIDKFPLLLGTRLLLGLGMAILAVAAMQLITYFNSSFSQVIKEGTYVGAITIIIYALILTTGAYFQHFLLYHQAMLSQVLGNLALLILIWRYQEQLAVLGTGAVLVTILFVLCGNLITAGAGMYFIKKPWQKLIPRYNPGFIKKIIKDSLPLGITLVFNLIYFRIDTLLLAGFRSSSEVGSYGLALKFFEFALALPAFLMNSVYPILLKVPAENLYKYLKVLLKWLFMTAVFMTSVVWFTAPLLGTIRSDFLPAVNLLRALSLGLPIFYLTSPLMWYLIIHKKQTPLVYIYGTTLILNVFLNLIYIPRFGATAAAIITTLTEGVVLIWLTFTIKKIYDKL